MKRIYFCLQNSSFASYKKWKVVHSIERENLYQGKRSKRNCLKIKTKKARVEVLWRKKNESLVFLLCGFCIWCKEKKKKNSFCYLHCGKKKICSEILVYTIRCLVLVLYCLFVLSSVRLIRQTSPLNVVEVRYVEGTLVRLLSFRS